MMGFKHKLKKIMGQSTTDDSGSATKEIMHAEAATNDTVQDSAVNQESAVADSVPNSLLKPNSQTSQNRQVGSKWEHKHGDLDWHSMSIPHPVPPVTIAESEVQSDTATAIITPQFDLPAERKHYNSRSISKQDLLCKFVVQHGKRIGETISIDGGHLVFKHGAEKLYIPMTYVSGFNEEDVQIGDFNRDEALRLGEEWYKRTRNSLKFDENGMLIND